MRALSKSKLLAFRQCPKRLWLEVHRPELGENSTAAESAFQAGHQIGHVARRLYDPTGRGALIDAQSEGYEAALTRSAQLLASSRPIFEPGFSAAGAVAFADVLLPARKAGKRGWRMVEVKSSTSVKDYHRDDIAIQAFVAKAAGVPLAAVALAHVDSKWTYPGGGDYRGLLVEEDQTKEAFGRNKEVKGWIADAQAVVRRRKEPSIDTGRHCGDPHECGFFSYCQSKQPQAKYPVTLLPGRQKEALMTLIEEDGITDLRDVPDDLLSEQQRRVKKHTLSGKVFFDSDGAAADLADHPLPAFFLDFETIKFAVPIWKGTRPYQQIPFQFSVHHLARTGKLEQQSFLDLSGDDPSKALAEALIAACGERGPVFAYNASFEKTCIKELAERHPRLRRPLLAINTRMIDLFGVARRRYYHHRQKGSWSLKSLLPAITPDLRYDRLDGVQDGGMAMNAYLETIHPATARARKEVLRRQLLEYCNLDTYALVRIWQGFAGRHDLSL